MTNRQGKDKSNPDAENLFRTRPPVAPEARTDVGQRTRRTVTVTTLPDATLHQYTKVRYLKHAERDE